MASETEYKADIMQRLGGESTFDFVVISWVGHIKADPKLKTFFSYYDANSLDELQKQFLETIFIKHPEDFDEDAFLLLRYYSLIDRGFEAKHFDLLVKHLFRAMNDAWVESDVVEEAIQVVKSYRRVYEFGSNEEEDIEVPVKSESSKAKKSFYRSSSGEGLLKLMRLKGPKRTKQETQ
jgi:truncated hemoglobin YjbI